VKQLSESVLVTNSSPPLPFDCDSQFSRRLQSTQLHGDIVMSRKKSPGR